MKSNWTFGTGAALLAIAAVFTVSTPSSRPGPESSLTSPERKSKESSKPTSSGLPAESVCGDPEKLLQAFLLAKPEDAAAPLSCYGSNLSAKQQDDIQASWRPLQQRSSSLRFIIATLPDPIHTHLSLLFDRKVQAIQQAAQDAGYEYDSSWLPWEVEKTTFTHLSDQDQIDDRTDEREDQPGMLLFRERTDTRYFSPTMQPFRHGLVVFVVGEEATRGIHRRQFQNAAAWIRALQPMIGSRLDSDLGPDSLEEESAHQISILGPSFSGSLPSLAQLLADPDVKTSLHYPLPGPTPGPARQLRIYSGSVSSSAAVEAFGTVTHDPDLRGWNIDFHSFLHSDETLLRTYCNYLHNAHFQIGRIAIISEDETAYGFRGPSPNHNNAAMDQDANKDPCQGALNLYYPRDISSLRAAYQSQSIFAPAPTQQSADTQRKNLTSDLADPSGDAHDTIRSYAGNQTPLSQEAELLGLVNILRDHHSQYLVIRSTNSLDPLFLTNFFRRTYPEGRVVILGTDLLFQRERGSTGITGVMLVSTYPMIPWDWTDWIHRTADPSHRVFDEDTVEGTYIAGRFLIHESFPESKDAPHALLASDPPCSDSHPDSCFVPINHAPDRGITGSLDIPDYKSPYFTVPENCENRVDTPNCQQYWRPSVWISVLGRTNFYPLDVFPVSETKIGPDVKTITESRVIMPSGMKLALLVILGLAAFHLGCCWKASFTLKPAFRAHFAATQGWYAYGNWQHPTLIAIGSILITFAALFAAWGCGALGGPNARLYFADYVWIFLIVVLVLAAASIVANQLATRRLENAPLVFAASRARFWLAIFLAAVLFFYDTFVHPIDALLSPFNRIPIFWRSMNLNSGVSPILPFFCMLAGLYIWFWYSLHGLALFGLDRPLLPRQSELKLHGRDTLLMFSCEKCEPAEKRSCPLEADTLLLALALFGAFAIVGFTLFRDTPLLSLGARSYSIIFCLWLDAGISLMLAEAWQLTRAWRSLKQLLSFLDRVPLRRTMVSLKGFSWESVWKMSGNVLDVRYKLLSRQIESMLHLRVSLKSLDDAANPVLSLAVRNQMQPVLPALTAAEAARDTFAKWYSERYGDEWEADFSSLQSFQEKLAALAGHLLTDLLIPAWHEESASLIQIASKDPSDADSGPAADAKTAPVSKHAYVRTAEELVCITYLAFIQNILGRLRTMVIGIVALFVAITLSLSTYPFDPRPTIDKILISLFIALGTLITLVYASMHRDSTLSNVTNTTPGELGTEFWIKLLTFGAAPLLGLLTSIFPELADFFFSWLQPGLAALK